jgi:hypothetical protein
VITGKTVKVNKDGLNSIWAKTEAKEEIPINIKFGQEYYIRCGITMGAFVGQPKIELVDNRSGEIEFNSINRTWAADRDLLIMKDGREVECIINGEDENYVYITLFKEEKEVETMVNKEQISQIERKN